MPKKDKADECRELKLEFHKKLAKNKQKVIEGAYERCIKKLYK